MGKDQLNGYDKDFFFKKLKRGVNPKVLSNIYEIPLDIMMKLKEAALIEPVKNESL
jgi:hypothetical protein